MEIVKEPQTEQQTSQELEKVQPEQPKKEPTYYVMTEEAIGNVVKFLKKLPWETVNEVLAYIDKNATPVKLSQPSNTQGNEENKEPLEK